MKHLFLLFALTCCFLAPQLSAQTTVKDTLDLGGEDVATTMDASRGLNQTISNRNWWLNFLKADSIRMMPEITFSRSLAMSMRNYTRDPGTWVPYQDLNIFFFLEDLEALQNNLLWKTYTAINAQSASEPPVRQSPLGGRGRPAAPGSDRVMANPRAGTGSVSVPPWYPIVRHDVLGEFNIRENPRYLRFPRRTRTAPDTRYSTTFKNSQSLNRLYRLAFYNGTSEEVYSYGAPSSAIIHPDQTIDVKKVVTDVYLDISAMVETEMRMVYNRQHPSAKATKLNARQIQEVMPMMNNASIPFTYKRILGARRQQINTNLPEIKSSLSVLVTQRDACRAFLSPEEASLFAWVIDQKTQLVTWQTAAVDGLGTILSASGNTAKYSQLMVVSEYLRVSTVLLSNLTENPKLPYALDRVKAPYYDAVMAVERDFRSKLNE
ncbi:hypothetical protein [Lewinella cohaerens]|uniref:hypothetical protein n=1 Tax=Lewinella cohaerens TaxID=70995 RepID=UPI0003715D48|nr:hypothetical protein [Lewinella cohaerens]